MGRLQTPRRQTVIIIYYASRPTCVENVGGISACVDGGGDTAPAGLEIFQIARMGAVRKKNQDSIGENEP